MSPLNDPRDLAPKGRTGIERRRGPRRVEEVAEHYTREALLAAVVEWHESQLNSYGAIGADADHEPEARRLHAAVTAWQAAAEVLQESWPGTPTDRRSP